MELLTERLAKAQSEIEWLRFALDSLPHVPWKADGDGNITEFSKRWLDLTGLSREEALGEGWMSAPHPDDLPRMAAAWSKSIQSGLPYQVEHRIKLADGGFKWMQSRAIPRRDLSGSIVEWFGTTEDIHDRKIAELTLKRSEERFRAAIGAVGILWTNNSDGKMSGEQPGWASLTGQTQEEYEGYGWSNAVHPDDAQPTVDAWNEAVRMRKTFVFEHRVRRHDGEWRSFAIRAVPLIDETGEVREWVGVHLDVTDLRQTETSLARREKEFRAIFEKAPGKYLVIKPDFTVVAISDRLVTAVGLKREQILNKDVFELFPDSPHDLEASGMANLRSSFDKVLSTKCPDTLPLQRYDIQSESGEWTEKWWSVINSPILGDDAEVLFIVHRTEDVTEYVKSKDFGTKGDLQLDHGFRVEMEIFQRMMEVQDANRELRYALESLKQSETELERRVQERTSELDALQRNQASYNYSISHDLRAPLRTIVSTARILQLDHGSELSADANELLERQAKSANKLGILIDELLKASRLASQTINLVPCDLSSIADRAASDQMAYLDAEWKVTIQPGLTAMGDPTLVKLVFENLIGNAMKYSSPGTDIKVGIAETGQGSAICVSDQGIGFDMAFEAKIWQPFQRLVQDKQYAGTGIGLYNVVHMLERMGGKIWAESEPGHGSRFYFTLADVRHTS